MKANMYYGLKMRQENSENMDGWKELKYTYRMHQYIMPSTKKKKTKLKVPRELIKARVAEVTSTEKRGGSSFPLRKGRNNYIISKMLNMLKVSYMYEEW